RRKMDGDIARFQRWNEMNESCDFGKNREKTSHSGRRAYHFVFSFLEGDHAIFLSRLKSKEVC
ncbi:hypothetical protein PJP07_30785, partial [Mycobacterium kansasii]